MSPPSQLGAAPPTRLGGADGVLSIVLLLLTVAYLAALPRNLELGDESFFLNEARRLREGEVLYRDVFDFITPLALYAMALLFALLGTTMATARLAMAVLHGLSVVYLYAAARRLGVRRGLAAMPGLAFLAVSIPAWPFASPHWFSTHLLLLLLLMMLANPPTRRPRWAVLPGVVSGLLIGVQHQRGVIVTAGIGFFFLVEYVIGLRFGRQEGWRRLVARLGWFATGIALVVVPTLAVAVGMAGFQPVYDALVGYPLDTYRHKNRMNWGGIFSLSAPYAEATFPWLLRSLPFVLLPAAGVATWQFLRGRNAESVRTLTVLLLFGPLSVLSIWYYPDVIHIAFIAPVFFVCAAAEIEWLLAACERRADKLRLLAQLATVVIVAGLGTYLWRNLVRAREQFPFAHETAFGRVDFATRWEPVMIDTVRGLLGHTASRELFCYPNLASPYLTTGGKNPTPYHNFASFVSPQPHIDTVLTILAQRSVPYIIVHPLFLGPQDPVATFIRTHYDLMSNPKIVELDELPSLWLYRHKNLSPAAVAEPR